MYALFSALTYPSCYLLCADLIEPASYIGDYSVRSAFLYMKFLNYMY